VVFRKGGVTLRKPPRRPKSWREKLANAKDFPRVVKITGKMSKRWGKGTIVIPTPKEVDQLMRRVPRGKVTTINHLREAVAKRHGATIGCPICCGIFARTAAGAAGEDAAEGRKRITPYWRTLKAGGVINEKYPGGVKNQKRLLEEEGHSVIQKGKRYVVKDFEKHLARL
jgi:alkylated DNA nucleotide flippase Atl1